jgi:hypothetical protein
MLGLALFGGLTLLMAMGDNLRALFFLWNLAVFVLLLKGFFVSFYAFSGPVSFRAAVLLTVGSLLSTFGSFPWPERPGPVRKPELF